MIYVCIYSNENELNNHIDPRIKHIFNPKLNIDIPHQNMDMTFKLSSIKWTV